MPPHLKQDTESIFEAIFALGANFLQQGKYEKALIIFDGLMALYPDHPRAAIAYGETLLMDGQTDIALEHFLAITKKFSLEAQVLLGAARSFMLLQKKEEAKRLLLPIIEGHVLSSSENYGLAKSIYATIMLGEFNSFGN